MGVLLLLASIGYALLAHPGFDFGGDPALYVGTAKSLAHGHGFTVDGRPQTLYPPGWPLILTLCQWFTSGSYVSFARFAAGLSPLAILGAAAFYKERGQRNWGWMLAAFCLSAGAFEVLTRNVHSEVIFLSSTVAFLAWTEQVTRPDADRRSVRQTAVGTLLLLASVATRSIGVALVAAILITWLHIVLRGSRPVARDYLRRMAVPLVAAGAFLVWWSVWKRTHGTERYSGEYMQNYGSQFWMRDPHHPDVGVASIMDVALRIPENLRIQAAHAGELLTNLHWLAPTWTSPILFGVVVVLLAGLWRELRRTVPIVAYYAVAYVGVLSMWPFDEGTRFLLPLLPLLVMLGWEGAAELRSWVARSPRRALNGLGAVAAIQFIVILTNAGTMGQGIGRQDLADLAVWGACAVMALPGLAGARLRTERVARVWPVAYAGMFALLGIVRIGSLAHENLTGALDPRADALRSASAWIGEHTPPTAVIMAQEDLGLHYTTNRSTVPLPITANPAVLQSAVEHLRPAYLVVIDNLPSGYYYPSEVERLSILRRAIHQPVTLRKRFARAAVYAIGPLPSTVSSR